ncbi:MAG: CARDB domain-containing protein [Caldilineaceae bacterium]
MLPAITTIRPNQGSTTEPNVINVRGRNFQDGATVRLGDLALTTTFVDATYLRADVPAGLSAGVYNITVTNPDGGQATLTHGYTVFDAATNDDLFGYDYELVTDPAAPLAGSPAQLRLKVHRQGGKQALANVKVRFYLGDPQHGGTLIGDGTIAALSPGASNNTSGVAWTPAAPGDATIYAVIDPENSVAETYEDNNVVQRTLTVLPPAADTVAPHVDSFTINDGAATTTERAVTLHVTASDAAPGTGIAKVLFVEFEFSQGAGDWAPVRVSEWLDYAAVQNGHTWSLVPASGMKYLQAWVADGAGNIALFPAKAFINFLPPLQRVAQNQRQSYRFPLEVGEVLSVRLEAVSGDPDLYIWAPDYTTRAPWVSNLRDSVDDLAITAPVAGNYQVEVHGFSAAEYRLLVVINPTELNAAAALGGQDPSKPLPSTPLSGNSEPASQFALNTPGAIDQRLYLPLIRR